jgi:hypothetical protein
MNDSQKRKNIKLSEILKFLPTGNQEDEKGSI